MIYETRYSIFPLGDSAITVDFGNVIDETINRHVMALFYQFQKDPLPGMIEAVAAYSSLTVYYDAFQLRKTIAADKTVYQWMEEQLTTKVMMPEELFKLKLPVRKEKVAEALSFLTDNKKIKHTKDNLLIWCT